LRYFIETKSVKYVMELNVESGFERSITVQGLKKIRVKVLKSDLIVLRELGQKLKAVRKTIFRSNMGTC